MTIEEAVKAIGPLNAQAMVQCKERWNSIAKPVHGFGQFEDVFMQIAGIQRSSDIHIEQKALLVACNGSRNLSGDESRKDDEEKMAAGLRAGNTYGAVLAKMAGAELVVVDADGFSAAEEAVTAGIRAVCSCREKGIQLLAVGDSGTADAVCGEGLAVPDILKKVEDTKRYDILVLAGVCLGGAALGIPVVSDGYVSLLAVLAAKKISPLAAGYVIPSQSGKSSRMKELLTQLSMEPFLDCGLLAGQGAGASMFFSLLDMANGVYQNGDTFARVGISPYKVMGCRSIF